MTELSKTVFETEARRWFSKSIFEPKDYSVFGSIRFDAIYEMVRTDYARYFGDGPVLLENILRRAELVGILLYRTARHIFTELNDETNAEKFSNLGRWCAGFEIYYSASVGEGLRINHGLGTVIGARTVIGKNALIHQGVTFGDKNGGRPVLGDHTIVYAGAKIIGNISIGNHAVVGANCVCMQDVPDHGTIAGIPGKLIMK